MIRWPNIVLGMANASFALLLLPSLLGPDKPDVLTSGPTALLLLGCVMALGRLRCYFAAACCALCGTGWLTLFLQKVTA